jgi:hypothetical protein
MEKVRADEIDLTTIIVTPVKTGVQDWIPAFAGMTAKHEGV